MLSTWRQHDLELSEYGTASAILLTNSLSEEAVSETFGKGAVAKVERNAGGHGPTHISFDVGDDGRTDMMLDFSRTFWGNMKNVRIDADADKRSEGQGTATRSFGSVTSTAVDQNGDGRSDVNIKVTRGYLVGLTGIEVDTNRDGKADHKLTPHQGFWAAQGLDVDLNNDGTMDGYIKFERNGWGNIDRLKFEKPR